MASTTRSAACAAATAAGMPDSFVDETEGTPSTAVAAGMNCAMAVSGAAGRGAGAVERGVQFRPLTAHLAPLLGG